MKGRRLKCPACGEYEGRPAGLNWIARSRPVPLDAGPPKPLRDEAAELRESQLRAEAAELRERQRAQDIEDRKAPRCAHCGVIERRHPGDHPFDARMQTRVANVAMGPLVAVGVIALVFSFFVSATTPGAPFHEITGPLMCLWDWKGTACS